MALGITLVTAFSLGLAATLVAVGVVAALSMSAMARRSNRLDRLMEAAPWASAVLIAVIGLIVLFSGIEHVNHAA